MNISGENLGQDRDGEVVLDAIILRETMIIRPTFYLKYIYLYIIFILLYTVYVC